MMRNEKMGRMYRRSRDIDREEEIGEQDGDQERAEHRLEPLQQVESRGHRDQHEGEGAKATDGLGTVGTAASPRDHRDRSRPRRRGSGSETPAFVGAAGVVGVQGIRASGRGIPARAGATRSEPRVQRAWRGNLRARRSAAASAPDARRRGGRSGGPRSRARAPLAELGGRSSPRSGPGSCPNARAIARANSTRSITSGPADVDHARHVPARPAGPPRGPRRGRSWGWTPGPKGRPVGLPAARVRSSW